jgi:hypothetical protein
MAESLRESLEATSAAMTEAAPEVTPEVTPDATPAPEPVETSATPAPESRADGRDASGRFAPKATAGESPGQAAPPKAPPTTEGAASSTEAPKPAQTTATEPPKPGEPDTTHAPPSWKISERQAWANAPKEVREAVHRRELEMARAVSQHSHDKGLATEVRSLIAPLAPAIQQRGITPQKLIASYVQFDQALTSRDPATQAHAVAQVMKAYGVPVEALADVLDGKMGVPQQRQLSVDEIREQVRAEERANWQQQQQQVEYRNHATRVQEFARKADPILFNEDVRHDMAALIEAAAARNVELSLQDAYDRAIRANPEAWAIVQQREQAKAAAGTQRATQRAEAAASSVKSRPASPVGGESRGRTLRADLEAAAADLSGRT